MDDYPDLTMIAVAVYNAIREENDERIPVEIAATEAQEAMIKCTFAQIKQPTNYRII